MRRAVFSGVLLALALAGQTQAQHGMGGGMPGKGGPGRVQGLFALEADWSRVCFELKVDDETLVALRPVFQKAWEQRKGLIDQMWMGEVDREMLIEKMTSIQKDLDEGIQQALTEEQIQALAELRSARSKMWHGGRKQPQQQQQNREQ